MMQVAAALGGDLMGNLFSLGNNIYQGQLQQKLQSSAQAFQAQQNQKWMDLSREMQERSLSFPTENLRAAGFSAADAALLAAGNKQAASQTWTPAGYRFTTSGPAGWHTSGSQASRIWSLPQKQVRSSTAPQKNTERASAPVLKLD